MCQSVMSYHNNSSTQTLKDFEFHVKFYLSVKIDLQKQMPHENSHRKIVLD